MSTCAVCQLSDGKVINLIIAEPTDTCPESECQLVLVPEGMPVDIGYAWDGSNFKDIEGNVVTIPVEEVVNETVAIEETE